MGPWVGVPGLCGLAPFGAGSGGWAGGPGFPSLFGDVSCRWGLGVPGWPWSAVCRCRRCRRWCLLAMARVGDGTAAGWRTPCRVGGLLLPLRRDSEGCRGQRGFGGTIVFAGLFFVQWDPSRGHGGLLVRAYTCSRALHWHVGFDRRW